MRVPLIRLGKNHAFDDAPTVGLRRLHKSNHD
jgi:hypothetical protein